MGSAVSVSQVVSRIGGGVISSRGDETIQSRSTDPIDPIGTSDDVIGSGASLSRDDDGSEQRNDDVTPTLPMPPPLHSTDLNVKPPGDCSPMTAMTMTVHLVTIERDPVNGSFGFTAGGENPVVVRQVTNDGPSFGRLQWGDEILEIDGRPVEFAPFVDVTVLLRNCELFVTLAVRRACDDIASMATQSDICIIADERQRYRNGSNCKKKKNAQSKRVRFADDILAATRLDTMLPSLIRQQSIDDDVVVGGKTKFALDAVKVFFENDLTKSFGNRTNNMTVKEVLESIRDKLHMNDSKYFGLLLRSTSSTSSVDLGMSLLPEHWCVDKICEKIRKMWLQNEDATIRCWFRYVFLPQDVADDLVNTDPLAFDYLYKQCCNDVTRERMASELSCQSVIKLCALSMLQVAVDEGLLRQRPETIFRELEKKWGLERFLPESILKSKKRKMLQKQLIQHLTVDHEVLMRDQLVVVTSSAERSRDAISVAVKLRYVNRLMKLQDFGGRYFDAALADRTADVKTFIGRRGVIEYVLDSTRMELVDLRKLRALRVDKPLHRRYTFDVSGSLVRIIFDMDDDDKDGIEKVLEESLFIAADQADDFVAFVAGYFRLINGRTLGVAAIAPPMNRDTNNNYSSFDAEGPTTKKNWDVRLHSQRFRVDEADGFTAPAADDIRKLDRGTLDSPNLPSNDEGQSPRDPPEPDAASSSSDFPESPGSGSNDVACRWTNAVDSAAAMTLSSPDETQLWSSNVVTRQLPPTDDSGSSSSGGVDIRLTSKSLAEEAPTSLEYFTASEHLDSSDEDEDKLMQRLTSLDAISLLSNLESSSSPSLEMKVSDAQMSNNDDEHSSAANCAIEKIDLTLILPPDDSCLEDDEVHDDIIKRLLECDVIIDPPKEFAWNDANQDVANMTAAAESTDDLPHEKNIHTTSDEDDATPFRNQAFDDSEKLPLDEEAPADVTLATSYAGTLDIVGGAVRCEWHSNAGKEQRPDELELAPSKYLNSGCPDADNQSCINNVWQPDPSTVVSMRGDDSVAYIEPLSNIDFENVSFVSNGYDPDCLTLYRQPLGGTCYGAGELSTVDIHFDFDDVLSSQLPIAIPPPPPPPPRRIFTFGTQEAETSGSSSVDCKDDPAESQQQQQQMFASVVTDGEVAYNDDHNCSSGTKDLSRVSDAVIKCVDFVSVSADDTNLASAFVSDAADNQSFASDLPSPPSPMLFNENGCDDNHPPPPLPASLPPSDARVADAERFDLG